MTRSDDELRQAWVGERAPHNAPVLLVDYDPQWPALFAREADRVRQLLGAVAVRVEHVGSTSVPGLRAKPIIDMLLVVPDAADEPAYRPALTAAGYVLRIREPDWYQHRLLKGPDTDINLHVLDAENGAVEIDRMLRFRDRLRTDPADRQLYEQTKTELAARTWRHVQHYADAKSEVVQAILGRAGSATPAPAQPSDQPEGG